MSGCMTALAPLSRLLPIAEFLRNLFKRDSPGHESDKKVIHKVCGFFDDPLTGIVFRRDYRFDGLLAQLLDDLVDALFKKPGGIAAFGPCFLPRRNEVIKLREAPAQPWLDAKARVRSGVARRAEWFHLDKHCVAVAIQSDMAHFLKV